jgi:hypothetical protein
MTTTNIDLRRSNDKKHEQLFKRVSKPRKNISAYNAGVGAAGWRLRDRVETWEGDESVC